MITCLKQF
ncbi:hypothetical protein VCHC17A1_3947A, partial [Vibrio cholerae HC-17A1]